MSGQPLKLSRKPPGTSERQRLVGRAKMPACGGPTPSLRSSSPASPSKKAASRGAVRAAARHP